MKEYVAFFDLDHTLISEVSGKILMQQAYKNGILSSNYIFQGIIFSILHKFDLINPDRIMDKMVNNLKGISESTIKELINKIFDNHFKRVVKEKAKTEIKQHKNNQGKTVILSASLPYICKPLKEILEMDDIICSSLEVQNGIFTGKPIGNFCYGKEKYLRAIQYCEEFNFSLTEAYFYTDSISDLPLLQVVGNPICVCPDSTLRQIAVKSNWIIYEW
jgi:HAD superfamily hydrolase (TIGR01490 family)